MSNQFLAQGQKLVVEKKYAEARSAFLMALEVEPGCVQAHNNIAVLSMLEKEPSQAESHFLKAISLDPKYSVARENLVQLYLKEEKWDQARNQLEIMRQDSPESQDVANKLALVYEKLDQPPQAQTQAGRTDYKPGNRPIGQGKAANEEARAAPSQKVLLACLPGLDNFVDDVAAELRPDFMVEKLVSDQLDSYVSAIKGKDIVWLEWGNQLAEVLTKRAPFALRGKKVVCRIHSYEVLDGLTDRIDFSVVSDLIFVAPHIREIFLKRHPGIAKTATKLHLVPNGIATERFGMIRRDPGHVVGFLGSINFKKDPMVLMHAFQALHAHDPRFSLRVGGGVQCLRAEVAIPTFLRQNGLTDRVTFDGPVTDVRGWLSRVNYIICTSLMEGHPVGLMEAMSTGCRPLIYAFPGADRMYPASFLWKSIPELIRRIDEPIDPEICREFVTENFSLQKQAARFVKVFTGGAGGAPVEPYAWRREKRLYMDSPIYHEHRQAAAQPGPDMRQVAQRDKYDWKFPSEIYAQDPAVRLRAFISEAQRQLEAGKWELAETSLLRAAKTLDWNSSFVVNQLLELYRTRQDIPAIQQLWKRVAVSGLRRGDLNQFLGAHYMANYAESMNSKDPDYSFSDIDEDYHAFMALAARQHPLAKWVVQKRALNRPDGRRLRIGFVLEGFSKLQSPIQRYRTLARHYDPSRYELVFYSRFSADSAPFKNEDYESVVAEMRERGCKVRYPAKPLAPLDEVKFLAENIVRDEIDIIFYQTIYFVPQLHFLSWLEPAFYQASTSHQQPELPRSVDACHLGINLVPDHVGYAYPNLLSVDKDTNSPASNRRYFGIPENAVVMACANRDIKYRNEANLQWWQAISAALERHENLYFLPLGLEKPVDRIPISPKVKNRVVALGFRTDLMSLLKMTDFYVDIFMHTSGAVMEAACLGLPVLAVSRYLAGAPFSTRNSDVTKMLLPDTELVVPHGRVDDWKSRIDRLVLDADYRRAMGRVHLEFAERFNPGTAVTRFLNDLESGYRAKMAAFKRINS